MPRHICHVFATFDAGGPQVRAAQVIARSPVEWRHTIFAMDGRVGAQALLPRRDGIAVFDGGKRAGSMRTMTRFAFRLASLQPDLLLTYNWGAFDAVVAGIAASVPTLHHEETIHAEERPASPWRRRLARRGVLPRIAGVVVPSADLAQRAVAEWGVPGKRVHLLPNGVDLARFQPRADAGLLRERLGIPRQASVLGWLGHMRPEKAPLRFVEMLRSLPNSIYGLMMGDGALRPQVEAAIAAAGMGRRVILAGHVERPEELLAAMTIYCSTSDSEQMPIATLEAMACGVPVVTTAVGEALRMLPSLARDCIVPVDGPQVAAQLAERVRALLHDEPKMLRVGEANRAKVAAEYGIDAVARLHVDLQARSLADRPSTRLVAGGGG